MCLHSGIIVVAIKIIILMQMIVRMMMIDDNADDANLSKFIILISHVSSSPRVLVVNYDHINIIST